MQVSTSGISAAPGLVSSSPKINPSRSYTNKQANSIGVTGFVTNACDGTVIGEAQGSQDALNKFVQHLNKGPPAASVTGVEHKGMETKSGESSFNVK
ncbi:hypothetical protein CC78DRAFT_453839 [Lojkania enalia]|uniref:acylphosphatase n=1 Tax=Lojkania enalia TaxID=147567 RepID=A0A9P4N9G6_9PLEO|nr:hypothetical protein CC78DRAFT_453839 [Didymosphaeria enalia]